MRERFDFAERKAIGSDGWISEGMQTVQKEEGLSQRELSVNRLTWNVCFALLKKNKKVYCNVQELR